jgi:hypothetical protein
MMHRFGPAVFGSMWDASVDQLVEWTHWSEAATSVELAQLRAAAHADGQAAALAAANCSR